jgi:hypothetical protein
MSIIVLNPFYICLTSLVMEDLYEASLRLASWNEVPVENFSIFAQFCNRYYSHDRSIISWSHMLWFPFCGRTGGCQTTHRFLVFIVIIKLLCANIFLSLLSL